MSGFSLRPARADDLDAALAIERSWPTTPGWSREQLAAELANPRSRFLVAELAASTGAGTGFAGFAVAWVVPPELQVMDLAAAPANARRGVGRALLRALLELGREGGCAEAYLEVAAGNAPALALYRSEGFEERSRRKRYYADGSDALVMARPL